METGYRNAPNVGAFYYEDAAAILGQSGCLIGRVEYTLPPRQSGGARVLTDRRIDIQPQSCRVLKCEVIGYSRSGEPICNLLVTPATEERKGIDEKA